VAYLEMSTRNTEVTEFQGLLNIVEEAVEQEQRSHAFINVLRFFEKSHFLITHENLKKEIFKKSLELIYITKNSDRIQEESKKGKISEIIKLLYKCYYRGSRLDEFSHSFLYFFNNIISPLFNNNSLLMRNYLNDEIYEILDQDRIEYGSNNNGNYGGRRTRSRRTRSRRNRTRLNRTIRKN